MRRPRWYRWSVVIVGRESGHRSPVSFIRMRHERQAVAWCVQMNARQLALSDLTYFEPRRIPR